MTLVVLRCVRSTLRLKMLLRLVLSMYFRLYFQVYFRVYFWSVRQPFFQNTVKKRFIDRTMLKLNCIFILHNHCSTVGLQANFADLNSHKARTSNFYVGGRVPNIYLLTKQQVQKYMLAFNQTSSSG